MARQSQVIDLVASECNSFAERFFSEHRRHFEDLSSADVGSMEQKAEWFDIFKKFEAESELTVQNALMLWGAVQAKSFEQEFIEAAMQSDALNDYLSLTEYPMFVKRMWREIQLKRERVAWLHLWSVNVLDGDQKPAHGRWAVAATGTSNRPRAQCRPTKHHKKQLKNHTAEQRARPASGGGP
ncbi:PFOR [Symbiodinium natans]|uniref:PFOR protein n=1 Tax=Symbiodinium natans TaxID=878477 RepID=A0A812H4K3_9DINO|nr:PFOR [Symbiodinium natans]